MSKILTWVERCEKHPDHQSGMVTSGMIQMRMQEEIEELRAELAQARDKALEEAAKFCDGVAGNWVDHDRYERKCGNNERNRR